MPFDLALDPPSPVQTDVLLLSTPYCGCSHALYAASTCKSATAAMPAALLHHANKASPPATLGIGKKAFALLRHSLANEQALVLLSAASGRCAGQLGSCRQTAAAAAAALDSRGCGLPLSTRALWPPECCLVVRLSTCLRLLINSCQWGLLPLAHVQHLPAASSHMRLSHTHTHTL